MRKPLLACIVIATTALTLHAQSVEEQLEAIRKKHNVPAIALYVKQADQVRARAVVGTIASDSTEPAKLEDAWHIGSNTKAMTATLAARLVERGVIKWETTIAQALPDLADKIDPAYHDITLEALFQHVSRVDSAREDAAWLNALHAADAAKVSLAQQRSDAIVAVLKAPPEAALEPAGFDYANANYLIAGAMLEAATGKEWETLMQEELFTPLKMTSAGFGVPPRIKGHDKVGEKFVPVSQDNPRALGPAGTVHLSLDDWAKFMSLHAFKMSEDYLTFDSIARMHGSSTEADYGMGWQVSSSKMASIIAHDGSNTLWYARAIYRDDADLTVLIVLNAASEEACDEATRLAMSQRERPAADK